MKIGPCRVSAESAHGRPGGPPGRGGRPWPGAAFCAWRRPGGPARAGGRPVWDAQGNATQWYSTGGAMFVPLPGGSSFFSAGRTDFLQHADDDYVAVPDAGTAPQPPPGLRRTGVAPSGAPAEGVLSLLGERTPTRTATSCARCSVHRGPAHSAEAPPSGGLSPGAVPADEAQADRRHHGLRAVTDLELLVDVRDVRLRGRLADVQTPPDLRDGVSRDEQFQYLELAWGQRGRGRCLQPPLDGGREAGGDERVGADCRVTRGRHHLVRGRVLAHEG